MSFSVCVCVRVCDLVCVIQHFFGRPFTTALNAHATESSPRGLFARTHTQDTFSSWWGGKPSTVRRARCGNVCRHMSVPPAVFKIQNHTSTWYRFFVPANSRQTAPVHRMHDVPAHSRHTMLVHSRQTGPVDSRQTALLFSSSFYLSTLVVTNETQTTSSHWPTSPVFPQQRSGHALQVILSGLPSY